MQRWLHARVYWLMTRLFAKTEQKHCCWKMGNMNFIRIANGLPKIDICTFADQSVTSNFLFQLYKALQSKAVHKNRSCSDSLKAGRVTLSQTILWWYLSIATQLQVEWDVQALVTSLPLKKARSSIGADHDSGLMRPMLYPPPMDATPLHQSSTK